MHSIMDNRAAFDIAAQMNVAMTIKNGLVCFKLTNQN